AELDGGFNDYVYRQTGTADAPLTAGMSYGFDQPHLDVDRITAGPCFNRVYSPWLNTSGTNRSNVSNSPDFGVTMTSLAVGSTSFNNRTTRISLAPDGKAYIIYKTREGSAGTNFENVHFNVMRSDDCGATWSALGATGTSVHGAGTVQSWFTSSWGNAAKGLIGRARSSDAWIAVDQTDGDIYAAYVSKDASTFGQIYVARSTDQGSTWASTRVTDGTHHSAYPEIAVAGNGAVGVLYIDYDDSGASTIFRHRFARSYNNGATWNDQNLQSMNPSTLSNASNGFLWGDYEGLTALGHTFYGVFTGESIGRVPAQMDPIFFKTSAVSTEADFYVRDWTDTMASGDDGAEPSTHASFYSTSDVWNQRNNVAPTFNANNQPINEDPRNGAFAAGDNFAFTRVFRSASGSAATVTTHFLFSEFGTGSNYQDAGSPAGTPINFGAGDATQTMSSGHAWHLDSTTSTHLCLAVEVSTVADPFMPPSLLGRAPGWPTTDLMVINDNNKAQRNMGVYYGTDSGEMTFYAIAHNAATFRRNMQLRYEAIKEALPSLRNARIQVIGQRGGSMTFKSGDTITLRDMEPGENRWIGLTMAFSNNASSLPTVSFYEMLDGRAINGFGITAAAAPLSTIIRSNLELHRSVFTRLAAITRNDKAKRQVEAAEELLKQRPDETYYRKFLQTNLPSLSGHLRDTAKLQKAGDPFGSNTVIESLKANLRSGNVERMANAHAAFLHKLDALLTMVQKSRGDTADILQTVRLQRELYARPELSRFSCAKSIIKWSDNFIQAYQARKAGNEDYLKLVEMSIGCYKETSHSAAQKRALAEITRNLKNPAELQKAHLNYLLALGNAIGSK
ncbi:MAG: sialidase family protein, partial [bacterium]